MSSSLALTETTLARPSQIDGAAGVVRNIKVLGRNSLNGRVYTEAALDDACRLFEGIVVYTNHPDPKYAGRRAPRNIEDRFGRLHGLYKTRTGEFAKDLRYNPRHPIAEAFAWAAEHESAGIGLSINAHTNRFSRKKDGSVLVEGIDEAFSVDLVDTPATVGGLFEAVMPRRVARPAPRPVGLIKDELCEQIHGDDSEAVAAAARGKRLAAKLFPTPRRDPRVDLVKERLLARLGR